MADRTSAALFGSIFEKLASEPNEPNKQFAAWLWGRMWDYDFGENQMCCDEALIVLGLARMGIHPEFPDDGEMIMYKDRD